MKEPRVVSIIKDYLLSLPIVETIDGEVSFIKNGCISDIVGINSSNQINYIVECKGSVSPGGIAGGLGQAVQYKYQKDYTDNISSDVKIVFACPYDMKKYIDKMEKPVEVNEILLVKEDGTVYLYTKNSSSSNSEKIIQLQGTAYIEGVEFELIEKVIGLLPHLDLSDRNPINFSEKIHVLFPSLSVTSHRKNTLIGLKKIGLVKNFDLTPNGYKLYGLLKESKEEFNKELIKIFYPFIINILNCMLNIVRDNDLDLNSFRCTNKAIQEQMKNEYGSEVRYFDKRRITYGIKMLIHIGAIEKKGNSTYKLKKITNF